ncbi:PE family protein [Gordonia sp. NPDC003429]
MAHESHLDVDPAQISTAAGDLDRLADRLERVLADARASLDVSEAGRDEVSQTAARTFTTVAAGFAGDTATGVHELRKIAATLRAQAKGIDDADTEAAASLRA